jgi:RNA polymerase sigma-70 factor, ECF subfamily
MPTGTRRAPDEATFAAFLLAQTDLLRTFLRRLCGNTADAEDLTQETLAKVWRLRASFDAAQNGVAWLHRAACRVFCDHRAQLRRQPRATAPAEAAATPPCQVELADELQHRLAGLTELERTLLLAFHRDGMSLQELANGHGLPLNTVKSHLHRARRRLTIESIHHDDAC